MNLIQLSFIQIFFLCWIKTRYPVFGSNETNPLSIDIMTRLKKEIREGIHGDYMVINLRKLRKYEIALNEKNETIMEKQNITENDIQQSNWSSNVFYMLKNGMSYIYDLREILPYAVHVTKAKVTSEPVLEVNVSDYVKMNLYSKTDPDIPFTITINTIFEAPIDKNLSTKILTHGWLANGNLSWLHQMKDKHFINGNYNFIILDWEYFAGMEYPQSVNNTQKVGLYVGELLELLIDIKKLQIETIHIIGHSLGAHVAGIIGRYIEYKFGQKIGRITGLDPAMPNFENVLVPFYELNEKRLDSSDAQFVDIIHTCSGILGYAGVYGHADFYPNNGTDQPGCTKGVFGIICHHTRSYELYIESVNSRRLLSTPCKSWKYYLRRKCKKSKAVSMGHYVDTKAKGAYFLRTRDVPPYGLG